MNFEKNECDRCTRICFVAVLGTSKLCDSCLTTLANSPDTKNVMKSLLETYGESMPQIEHD